uniref:Tudor domain-containing protein n=1 Tax=Romanomermis culicivorax TaxID=13658 RepID=A0A915HFL3_ROMCU
MQRNEELSTAVPYDRMAYENLPCVVAYANDGTYYRARVTHVGSEDCKIVFSDWGNGQFAKFSDMRPLMKQFAVVPPLALRCRLDGVVERTLVRSVIDKFNAKISENLSKRFVCVIKRVENNVFYVDLFDRETKTNIGLEYMPVDDMVPGFTSRLSIADKMNKKDTESLTPISSSETSKKRSSSSDSTSTDSDAVVCYDSETELFTTFSGKILTPVRSTKKLKEETNDQDSEKSKINGEFKNVEGWQPSAPMVEQSASPPPLPSTSEASTFKNVVDSSTSPTRPSTPITMIFKVKAPAPPVMREAASEHEQTIDISNKFDNSDSAVAAGTATNVAQSSTLPSNNQVETIPARQEPIFEKFRPVLLDAEQYYRTCKSGTARHRPAPLFSMDRTISAARLNLEEKMEKYRRGEYANTLEAFLDGVPVADDDEDEFVDSSEEEAAEQRRRERKKKKTLKQLKREFKKNQQR